MITVNHSACLLLGGSFEPTYILTINALPVQIQPTTNKRNAAMIQSFMTESIGVTPDRGIVKFIPIPEESLAMNGMTILGDIERLERQQADETGIHVKRAITKASRKSVVSKAKSSMQLSRKSSKTEQSARAVLSLSIPTDGPLDSGVAINEKGVTEPATVKLQGNMNSKKSEPMLSKFNKNLAPPPIPADKTPTPGISKRKSFMSVFRRT